MNYKDTAKTLIFHMLHTKWKGMERDEVYFETQRVIAKEDNPSINLLLSILSLLLVIKKKMDLTIEEKVDFQSQEKILELLSTISHFANMDLESDRNIDKVFVYDFIPRRIISFTTGKKIEKEEEKEKEKDENKV